MFTHKWKFLAMLGAILAASGASAGEAPPAYVKQVMTQIFGKVEYPKMARMRHQEGVVTIQLSVDAGGAPSGATVEKSSGIQSLDDAAMAAVAAAAPFPAPPEPGLVIHGNIRFSAE